MQGIVCAFGLFVGASVATAEPNPADGFVDIHQINPRIQVELRYAGPENFIGRKVAGYEANRCFLTRQAAVALDRVQRDLAGRGLGLHLFDCYRPQRAVRDFVEWARGPEGEMKSYYYPDVPKALLFERGYIAKRSGHSRGSTVDLTLVVLDPGGVPAGVTLAVNEEREPAGRVHCPRRAGTGPPVGALAMGTPFDCFSEASATRSEAVSREATENRRLLRSAMEKQGFSNYAKEWWHYRLKAEPHRQRYFDFAIR